MAFNLPPGCRFQDVPGNSNLDWAWDTWFERMERDDDPILDAPEEEQDKAFRQWLEAEIEEQSRPI